jgi:hypothetical protein
MLPSREENVIRKMLMTERLRFEKPRKRLAST